MEKLKAHSHNSIKLKDRILWFDGDSTVANEKIVDNIVKENFISSMFVAELTEEMQQYNKLVPKDEQVSIKTTFKDLSFEWNIPDQYKKLDVVEYVSDKLLEQSGNEDDIAAREERCADELILYKKLGLFDTLRALIYIINILEEKNIVWGVGRGSSVSSYVLYIIGVHDVDSFLYDLNIEEFLRT